MKTKPNLRVNVETWLFTPLANQAFRSLLCEYKFL